MNRITENDLLSIGILRRTHYRDLPPFVFVKRDGLFVPFPASDIAEIIGEEGFVLRSDIQEDEEGMMTWQDLVGYSVMDGSTPIGTIAHIDESTINTLATLQDGRMIPLHEDFIIDIDESTHILHVQLPFAL